VSSLERALLARASVLRQAQDGSISWSQLTKLLAQAAKAGAVIDWGDFPSDFSWSGFPGNASPEVMNQSSLFEIADVVEVDLDPYVEHLERLQEMDIKFRLCIEEDFPSRVTDVSSPPPFLFFTGEFLDGDSEGVAVIGTRRASRQGLEAASRIAGELVVEGRPVVSGLAAGIDTAALSSSLENGGRTIAVIGTGILQAYPTENSQLQRTIADMGLLISQFLPNAAPSKASFPMRNAVMAAYADASLVVEAGDRSGARMQARIASEMGRKVFLYEPIMASEGWAVAMVDDGKARFVTTAGDLD